MENSFQLDNEQLKAQVAKQYQKQELQFPTEVIDLPSKGLVYPEGHPLRDGRVEMKYMTAKEEDILSSESLIRKGIVLDKLFRSLIIGNGDGVPFNYDDLVTGDKDAIMIAARVLGYGKDYTIKIDVAELDEPHEVTVDLTTLNDNQFDESLFEKHGNNIPYILPAAKKQITFKILNGHDEKLIASKLKKKDTSGIKRDNSTRLKHIITSIDGDEDKSTIDEFVDNYLLSRDSFALKEYIKKIQPGVDMRFLLEIPEHEISRWVDLPIGLDFFWPGV